MGPVGRGGHQATGTAPYPMPGADDARGDHAGGARDRRQADRAGHGSGGGRPCGGRAGSTGSDGEDQPAGNARATRASRQRASSPARVSPRAHRRGGSVSRERGEDRRGGRGGHDTARLSLTADRPLGRVEYTDRYRRAGAPAPPCRGAASEGGSELAGPGVVVHGEWQCMRNSGAGFRTPVPRRRGRPVRYPRRRLKTGGHRWQRTRSQGACVGGVIAASA